MVVVSAVEPGSLGDLAGFLPGDRIRRVNGEDIADLIDFQVHTADRELELEIEREGEDYVVEVLREPGESFGFSFAEMELRRCHNNCVFCFIHQMPEGLRPTLYVEDDDYRLSFLHGAYVTLTNVKERDLQRIIDQRLSPQYISVHATDPQLRLALLGRKRASGDLLARIRQLAEGGIEMHTQVVLCPGWNDGEQLVRTVTDLSHFYPAVRSVAMVPVGLSRHRQGLPELQPVTVELARDYVAQAESFGRQFSRTLGERFVYAADELFLLQGQEPPPASYYDAFPQVENGIGMVRTFIDRWCAGRGQLPVRLDRPFRLAMVTGVLAAVFMRPIVAQLAGIDGLQVDLVEVTNDFFGAGITVSGLLTGGDMVAALRRQAAAWDLVLLPPNCINGEGVTLDDMTVPALASAVGVPVAVGDYDLTACVAGSLAGTWRGELGQGRQLSELGFQATEGQ